MDDVGVSVQMKAKTRNNAAFNFFFYYYILFIGFGSGEWDVNEGWPVLIYNERKKKKKKKKRKETQEHATWGWLTCLHSNKCYGFISKTLVVANIYIYMYKEKKYYD